MDRPHPLIYYLFSKKASGERCNPIKEGYYKLKNIYKYKMHLVLSGCVVPGWIPKCKNGIKVEMRHGERIESGTIQAEKYPTRYILSPVPRVQGYFYVFRKKKKKMGGGL